MDDFDVCVIGGGPAGMMAALSAKKHHPEKSIVLLDRTFELGRKLLVAGAGRGNLTNINLQKDPSLFVHGPKELISATFSQFGYQDIVDFFNSLGVPLYEEQKTGKGKMFPVIDHAKTVRDILVDEINRQRITVLTNAEVLSVKQKKEQWRIQTTHGFMIISDTILSCGGITYPSLGSNGSGYGFAKNIGHTIIEPVPSAVPLVSKNVLSHLLQGEKLQMQVTTIDENSSSRVVIGDVLFTQYGVSGSAILDVSRDISILLHRDHKNEVSLHLSFFPGKTIDEISALLEERWKNHNDQLVSRNLWGLVTTKVSGAVCAASGIAKEQTVGKMKNEEKQRLVKTLSSYKLIVTDTRGWNEAEFTAGGVAADEVDIHSLASKKAPHLYIVGELLDVDGDIGGYNLSWAWASGWVAGKLQ
ncbi:MAG: aminoacetone oxidase family FAD-binding enzyme [Candidatus Gottesmanbacteria bacterium]